MNDELLSDGYVLEEVPDDVRIAIEYLIRVKNRLGIPDEAQLDDENKVLLRYAREVYRVWAALFPLEHREFIENTAYELKYERPVHDAVKAGGYSPVSYPARLDNMYHVLLPKVRTQDRRFWEPLMRNIPELKRTNYFK